MPNSPSEPAESAEPTVPVEEATARTSAPPSADRERPYDLAVVGAGPAGLAAAVKAADLGLCVALVDAGPRPGGQFYRHPAPELGAAKPEALHHRWGAFTALAVRFAAHRRAGTVRHVANHHVWTVERTPDAWTLHTVAVPGTESRTDEGDRTGVAAAASPVALSARSVLLATGAYERQLPFPGWTLPGVVSAGGAQAMLKSGLVLPGSRIVVAGSGPLLLAVAASLAAAGAEVPAVIEAAGYLGYGRHLRALAGDPSKFVEGGGYAATLARHRIRVRTRAAVVEAHGTDRVRAVTVAELGRDWEPLTGRRRRIECDAVAVGHGLLPQLELATALGCETGGTPDGAVAVTVDEGQRTSVDGVWAAGETVGVGGAELAMAEGESAALDIAAVLRAGGGRAVVDAVRLRRRRERLRGFADAMGAVHAPGAGWTGWVSDETEVCRCEEVSAGRVREAVDELGAGDARTAKLLTRAGMGWCQGRMCGPAVAALSAPGAAPAADRRPLSCPVPLGTLAALPPRDAERPAP